MSWLRSLLKRGPRRPYRFEGVDRATLKYIDDFGVVYVPAEMNDHLTISPNSMRIDTADGPRLDDVSRRELIICRLKEEFLRNLSHRLIFVEGDVWATYTMDGLRGTEPIQRTNWDRPWEFPGEPTE